MSFGFDCCCGCNVCIENTSPKTITAIINGITGALPICALYDSTYLLNPTGVNNPCSWSLSNLAFGGIILTFFSGMPIPHNFELGDGIYIIVGFSFVRYFLPLTAPFDCSIQRTIPFKDILPQGNNACVWAGSNIQITPNL